MTQSLLALDLALHAGYAQWTVGEQKTNAGLLTIKATKDSGAVTSLGFRLASLYRWTFAKLREWSVTDIAIEEPLVAGGAGKASQFHWLISAYGVVCMAAEQCKTNGVTIHVVPIANATMAVHWLGSRDIEKKLRKPQSLLEAQRRGLKNITAHDTADAFGVLSTRIAQLGLTHLTPWDSKRSPGPLFTGPQLPGTTITKSNQRAAAILTNKALSFEREKL